MKADDIIQAYQTTCARIYKYAPGRKVRLLAVSKGQPIEKIRILYAQGQREFGENYAQELITKAEALQDLADLRWVYIGHIQSNKLKKIMSRAAEIQTLSSIKQAQLAERYAEELQLSSYPVSISINCENEISKGGASWENISSIADFINRSAPRLSLEGIMAIPPSSYKDDAEKMNVPDLYKRLRSLASVTGKGVLSLGMSSDLELALRAGSDCVRIGTSLFGSR